MITTRTHAALASLLVVAACGRTPVAPAVEDQPAVAASGDVSIAAPAVPVGSPAASRGRQDVLVNMLDACDPQSFNAVLGPGSCLRGGGMSFDRFIAQLTQLGVVGPWRFSPQNSHVKVGQAFVALNKGGEVHTFTEVAEFGGGIVGDLNQLAGVPVVAPECAALEPADFVAPGSTSREQIGHAGTVKFQCCIHPWMKLEASASVR